MAHDRRNPYALSGSMRSGAGPHKHPKHVESAEACRRFDPNSIVEDEEEKNELQAFWEYEEEL